MIQAESNTIQFSEEEKEILQELMNISFGKVAAELAEIIDVLVVLSVPKVSLISGRDFPDYLSDKLKLSPPFNIVEQSFSGKLNGHAILVFPSGSEKKLVSMFGDQQNTVGDEAFSQLEKETLIEIGNVLTGACVGKLVEQLNEVIYPTLPRLTMATTTTWKTQENLVDPESVVILVKTDFKFEANGVKGYLFIITNQESFSWLKKALHRFLGQFI